MGYEANLAVRRGVDEYAALSHELHQFTTSRHIRAARRQKEDVRLEAVVEFICASRFNGFSQSPGAGVVFGVSLWLVRSQTTVDDTEYMAAMIPHHSIAIMTSERASLKDPRVRELAQAIIVAQRREIAEMKYLIDDIEQNGPRTEERLPEEMQP